MKTDSVVQSCPSWADGFWQWAAPTPPGEVVYLETAFGGVVLVHGANQKPALVDFKILPWLVVVSVVGTWAIDSGTPMYAQEEMLKFPSSQEVDKRLAEVPADGPSTVPFEQIQSGNEADPEPDLLAVPQPPASQADSSAVDQDQLSGATPSTTLPVPDPKALVQTIPEDDGVLSFEPPPRKIPKRDNSAIAQAKPDEVNRLTPGIQNVPEMWVLFDGGSDSLVAKAVGAAEGTRTPQGDRTPAYFGHTDPGNQVWNLGTFSYQHGADSPEEADRKQLRRLAVQTDHLQQQAAARGMTLTLVEKLNGIDLANQAPEAALSEIGYIKWLQKAHEQGMTGEAAIVWARVKSFIDPETGTWDAPGLGNDPEFIEQDQQRRFNAISKAIVSHQQTSPIAPTHARSIPELETSIPEFALPQPNLTAQQPSPENLPARSPEPSPASENLPTKSSPDQPRSLWSRLADKITGSVSGFSAKSRETDSALADPIRQEAVSQLGSAPPVTSANEPAQAPPALWAPPGLTPQSVDGSIPYNPSSTVAQDSDRVQPSSSERMRSHQSPLGGPSATPSTSEDQVDRIIFQDLEPHF